MKQSLNAWIHDKLSCQWYIDDAKGKGNTVYIKTKYSEKTTYSNNIDIVTRFGKANVGKVHGVIDYDNLKFYSNNWFKYQLEQMLQKSIIKMLDDNKEVDSIIDAFDDRTKSMLEKDARIQYILNTDPKEYEYHPMLKFSSDDLTPIKKVSIIQDVDSYCDHYAFEYIEENPNCLEKYSYVKYRKNQIELLKNDNGWVQEYKNLYDYVRFYHVHDLTITFMVNGKLYSGNLEQSKLINHYLLYDEPAFNLNDMVVCCSEIMMDNNVKHSPFNIIIKWDNVMEVKHGEKLILKKEQFEPIIYKE